MSLKPHPSSVHDDNLDLTVRFSAPLPDLLLTISLREKPHANTSTLKSLIRTHLPSDYHDRRIRLIQSGKALVDDTPLATSLKRPVSRPPSRAPTPAPYQKDEDAKGKGKAPVRDPPLAPAQARIYIHCSIGDVVLSAAELLQESVLANPTQDPTKHGSATSSSAPAASAGTTTATIPSTHAPRGFDRLLSSGFTSAEVGNLRLQFLSIQSHTHTPDTMPSPTTLRNMEDQWLDNSSSLPNADAETNGLTGAAEAGGGFGGDDEAGALDDMLYGTAMGFFWPIGCLVWGVREEGVWSRRRKMAVVVGVMLNVGLGLVRYGQ